MYIGNERVTNRQFREACNAAYAHERIIAASTSWPNAMHQAVIRIVLAKDAPLAHDLAILFGRLWEVTAPNPAPIRLAAAPTGADDDSLEDDVPEDAERAGV